MKKRIILITLLISAVNLYSQNFDYKKPDYTQIEKIIQDEYSEFYYPKLMERYRNSDTTLTIQDYRILYYGFMFQDAYSPYGTSDYVDSVRQVFSKDSLQPDDFKTVIRFQKKILEEHPFNLRDLNTLTFAYYQIGDTISTALIYFKLDKIIEAILSTGDGETEYSGWHVISVSHEYDLLNILGFEFGGMQTLTNNQCDFLKVNDNEYGIQGLYFDVGMLLKRQSAFF